MLIIEGALTLAIGIMYWWLPKVTCVVGLIIIFLITTSISSSHYHKKHDLPLKMSYWVNLLNYHAVGQFVRQFFLWLKTAKIQACFISLSLLFFC